VFPGGRSRVHVLDVCVLQVEADRVAWKLRMSLCKFHNYNLKSQMRGMQQHLELALDKAVKQKKIATQMKLVYSRTVY